MPEGTQVPLRDSAASRVGKPAPEPLLSPLAPGEAFGRHFLRCFFCHIGDRYTEDHFCEEGRELIVALLDELVEA